VIETLTMREPSRDLLTLHYAEHAEKAFFPALLDFMASGPLVAMVASGQDIIQAFRNMAGATNPTEAAPGSIRGDYGRDWGLGVIQNVVHGSDSPESANREIGLWFPGLSTN
jgi:nucleoside-diphosphate kinase